MSLGLGLGLQSQTGSSFSLSEINNNLGAWYYGPSVEYMAVKNGTDIYGTGIKSTAQKVVWHWDGATYDEAEIRLSDSPDDHNQPSIFVDARDGGLAAAEADHGTTNDVRFYYAADGDPDSLSNTATITMTNPTYIHIYQHSGGDGASIWTRNEDNIDGLWSCFITSDFTAATPTFSNNGIFRDHYLYSCQALDESGTWLLASGQPNAYNTDPTDPTDPKDTRFWGQSTTIGFHRYSDDALLIGGGTEIPDLTSVSGRINMQSRNILRSSHNLESAEWDRQNINMNRRNVADHFGLTGVQVYEPNADSSTGLHFFRQSGRSVTAGDIQIASVWVKANGLDEFRLDGVVGSMTGGALNRPYIHVQDIGATPSLIASDHISDWGYIESAEDSAWRRFWFISDATDNTTTGNFQFLLSDGGSVSFTNNAAGLYFGHPQLEIGDGDSTGPTAYISSSNDAADYFPDNQPPIMYESSEGFYHGVMDVKQVESGMLELVVREQSEPLAANGDRTNSTLKYIRYNTTTHAQESVTEIASSGDREPYGRADILAKNRVVYCSTNDGGSGNNVMKVWDGGRISEIKSSSSDLYRPVVPVDMGTRLPSDEVIYLEGTYTSATSQSVTAKLGQIE